MPIKLTHVLADIRAELGGIETTRRALRSFGFVVGTMLTLLSAWTLWAHDAALAGIVLAGPGTLLVAFAALDPTRLRRAHRIWMGTAILLGLIVTPMILTVVYVLVVTPIGLALRLLGKDPLVKEPDASAKTYWIPKEYTSEDRSRLERYY